MDPQSTQRHWTSPKDKKLTGRCASTGMVSHDTFAILESFCPFEQMLGKLAARSTPGSADFLSFDFPFRLQWCLTRSNLVSTGRLFEMLLVRQHSASFHFQSLELDLKSTSFETTETNFVFVFQSKIQVSFVSQICCTFQVTMDLKGTWC